MYGELGERKSITNKDEVTDRGGEWHRKYYTMRGVGGVQCEVVNV